MQLLCQIYDNEGKIHSTELVLTSHNALKKSNVHRLMVGEAKYQLTKNGAVTLTAEDKSKIVFNLYGGKFKENELITDREILSVFGTKVITVPLIEQKIKEIRDALNADLTENKAVSDNHINMITNIIEKLDVLRDAFLQVGKEPCQSQQAQ